MTEAAAPAASAARFSDEAPLRDDIDPARPRHPSTAAMLILAGLALVVAVKSAAPILVPALLAGLVALLLNPLVRGLHRRWLPRWLAALIVMGSLSALLGLALWMSYEPAQELAERSTRLAWQFKQKIERLMQPLASADRMGEALETIDALGKDERPKTVAVIENSIGLSERYGGVLGGLAIGTSAVVLVYLLLVFGDLLFRKMVALAPTLARKRETVAMVRAIQTDVTRYVATVTAINLGLGAAAGVALHLAGLPNALFWGLLAALLNFIPYLGPLLGALLLLAVGVLQFDAPFGALLPAGLYLLLNLLESQLVTPLVLGRSFSLNPVVILIWLLFWGWLWGVPGLLLAMPLLVCGKIVAARSALLRPFALMVER